MSPTHPAPRVTTDRVARHIEAHRLTDSGDSLACRIGLDLLDARQQIAELEATILNERGEGDPPSGIPTQAQRDEDVGRRHYIGGDGWYPCLDVYGGFGWWGYWRGGREIVRAMRGVWVPLFQDAVGPGTCEPRPAPERTYRSAMRAADAARVAP